MKIDLLLGGGKSQWADMKYAPTISMPTWPEFPSSGPVDGVNLPDLIGIFESNLIFESAWTIYYQWEEAVLLKVYTVKSHEISWGSKIIANHQNSSVTIGILLIQ